MLCSDTCRVLDAAFDSDMSSKGIIFTANAWIQIFFFALIECTFHFHEHTSLFYSIWKCNRKSQKDVSSYPLAGYQYLPCATTPISLSFGEFYRMKVSRVGYTSKANHEPQHHWFVSARGPLLDVITHLSSPSFPVIFPLNLVNKGVKCTNHNKNTCANSISSSPIMCMLTFILELPCEHQIPRS